MHAHTALLKDLAVRTSVRFLEELTADYRHKDFAVRLWDGTEWGDRRRPRFTLVPNHPGALRNMFTSPCEFTLGEAFIDDDFDIEGEIEGAFDLADFLFLHEHSLTEKLQLGSLFARLPATDGHDNHDQGADLSGAVHSKERDRNAVTRHYDVSNEFYKHWLSVGTQKSAVCPRPLIATREPLMDKNACCIPERNMDGLRVFGPKIVNHYINAVTNWS